VDEIKSHLNQDSYIFNELKRSYKVRKNWEAIVGGVLAKQLAFDFLKGQWCYILADNPCWTIEINIYKEKILENINNYVRSKNKIRFLKVSIKNTADKKEKRQYAVRKKYDNMIGR
jgi:hypothetical protein